MERKVWKKFSLMLSLLLLFSIITPLVFIPSAAPVLASFYGTENDFDYATVMNEPRVIDAEDSVATLLSKAELKNIKLYPGGIPFGVKFMTEGILIVGFCDISNSTKKENPSSTAGLKLNDRIISVDGKELSSAAQFTEMVENSNGHALSVIYIRNGERYTTTLTPVYSQKEQCYKTGMYVKDNGAGIGTVTYIVPESFSFAGLGHGICEGDKGKLVPIQRGAVVGVTINGIVKGQCGTPGEVKGYFSSGKTGTLLQNTGCGVFGVFASLPSGLPSEPLSLCLKEELKEGKAYIYSTLDEGTPKKYEIQIEQINRSATEGKCFTVKVTDPALLEKTGGIVQGMSGSPIIQNGKLVGAVTHVMINDPTTGYGIFIENMLNASQMNVMPRAA